MGEPVEPAPPVEAPVPAAPVMPAPAEAPTAGFFDEAPGERSAMRLITIVSGLSVVGLALVAGALSLLKATDIGQAMQVVTTLLSFSVGGKLLHKFAEGK